MRIKKISEQQAFEMARVSYSTNIDYTTQVVKSWIVSGFIDISTLAITDEWYKKVIKDEKEDQI